MSLEFFNLLLWIPFLLVFLGTGISFCLKGFKKGIFHALVSTGATVVATFVSYFAAKFLASFAVDSVLSLLPDFSGEVDSGVAAILPMVMEGIVTGLLALIIFSVLLAILAPVGKFLFALIPTPKAKGLITRLLGLALRFAEGVVLTVLLLLPIYGTLGVYAPAVDMTLALNEEASVEATNPAEELTVRDYVRCAAEHPVVFLAKTTPFTTLYNGLSGGGAINVPKAIQTITTTVDAFQAIMKGDFSAVDWDIFAKLQKDLLSADWFYSVFTSISNALESRLNELGGNAPAYLKAIQELMALPKETFTQCSSGILDWMSFAAEKGMFQAIEGGTFNDAWLAQSGIKEKASEIQNTLPTDFPFVDLVDQFIADSVAKKG